MESDDRRGGDPTHRVPDDRLAGSDGHRSRPDRQRSDRHRRSWPDGSTAVRAAIAAVALVAAVALLAATAPGAALAAPDAPEACAPADFDGNGTVDDPYVVTNVSELQCVGAVPTANVTLGADVDATNASDWDDGAGFDPIANFSGTLDGQGHAIVGLSIDRDRDNVGLFAELNGTVRNVTLARTHVEGANRTGALYGVAENATVANVTASGSVGGNASVGGLGGEHRDGTVRDASVAVRVSGGDAVGGLLGQQSGGVVHLGNATVSRPVDGGQGVGGLVGAGPNATIRADEVAIESTVAGDSVVGGVLGDGRNATVDVERVRVNGTVEGIEPTRAVAARTENVSAGTVDVAGEVHELPPASRQFEGSGTGDDPFQIGDAEDLQAVGAAPDAQYVLESDVDATDTAEWNDGAGFHPIESFSGSLDGQGHAIEGLTIDRHADRVGLFGTLEGNVSNLALRDVDVAGRDDGYTETSVGALFGKAVDASVGSVEVTGTVRGGEAIGAVGGVQSGGAIDDAVVDARVLGPGDDVYGTRAGGVVGRLGDGAAVSVAGFDVAIENVNTAGGVVGRADHATIEVDASTARTNVSAGDMATGGVGQSVDSEIVVEDLAVRGNLTARTAAGIVGFVRNGSVDVGTVEVTGEIDANSDAGGLVDQIHHATISVDDVVVDANVSGSHGAAGIATYAWNGTIVVGNASVGHTIWGDDAGGLLSDVYRSEVDVGRAAVDADVTGDTFHAGGAITYVNGSTVTIDTVTMNGTVFGDHDAGGVVGEASWTDLSLGTVDVNATVEAGSFDAGGVLAYSYFGRTEIGTATVRGEVLGDSDAGGLVGYHDSDALVVESATIDAPIESDSDAGGLVGYNYDARFVVEHARVNEPVRGGQAGGIAAGVNSAQLDVGNVSIASTVNGSYDAGGLYGWVYSTSPITTDAIDVDVTGEDQVGGVAGDCSADVRDVTVTGTVSGSDYNTGGVCGSFSSADIHGVEANVTVSGGRETGGLVGYAWNGTVANSAFEGTVDGTEDVGGAIGDAYDLTVRDVRTSGTVDGTTAVGGIVGRLSGENTSLQQSLSLASVDGGEDVGAVVGSRHDSTVRSVYYDESAVDVENGSGIGSPVSGGDLTGVDAVAAMRGLDFPRTWAATEGYPDLAWRTNDSLSESVVFELGSPSQGHEPADTRIQVDSPHAASAWDRTDRFGSSNRAEFALYDGVDYRLRLVSGDWSNCAAGPVTAIDVTHQEQPVALGVGDDATDPTVLEPRRLFVEADSPTPVASNDVRFRSCTDATDPQWSFGDDTSATGDDVVHVYDEAGTYEVALEAGGETTTRTLEVEEPPIQIRDARDALGGSVIEGLFTENEFTVDVTSENDVSEVVLTVDGEEIPAELVDTSGGNQTWRAPVNHSGIDDDVTVTVEAVDSEGYVDREELLVRFHDQPDWVEWLFETASGSRADVNYPEYYGYFDIVFVDSSAQINHLSAAAPWDNDFLSELYFKTGFGVTSPPNPYLEAGFDGGGELELLGVGAGLEGQGSARLGPDYDLVRGNASLTGYVSRTIWQMAFDPPVIGSQGVEAEGTLEVGAEAAFQNGPDGLEITQGEVQPAVSIEGSSEIGVTGGKLSAAVFGGTGANIGVSLDGENLLQHVEMPVEAGVRGDITLVFFSTGFELTVVDGTITLYDANGQAVASMDAGSGSIGPLALADGRHDWELLDPRGPNPGPVLDASAGNGSIGAPGTEHARLTDREYDDTEPALATVANETVLAWSSHPAGEPITDGRDVLVRTWNGSVAEGLATGASGNASQAVRVTDDDRHDTDPDLAATDRGDVLATWSRLDVNATASTPESPAALNEHHEIAVAASPANASAANESGWTPATLLTDSWTMNAEPVVAAGDDRWLVAWERSVDRTSVQGRSVEYALLELSERGANESDGGAANGSDDGATNASDAGATNATDTENASAALDRTVSVVERGSIPDATAPDVGRRSDGQFDLAFVATDESAPNLTAAADDVVHATVETENDSADGRNASADRENETGASDSTTADRENATVEAVARYDANGTADVAVDDGHVVWRAGNASHPALRYVGDADDAGSADGSASGSSNGSASVETLDLDGDVSSVDELSLDVDGSDVLLTYRGTPRNQTQRDLLYRVARDGDWIVDRRVGGGPDVNLTVWRTDGALRDDGFTLAYAGKPFGPDAKSDAFVAERSFAADYALRADAPDDADAGEPVEVEYEVRNVGEAPGVDPVPVAVAGDGSTLANETVGPIAPGETVAGNVTVAAPANGTLYVAVGDAASDPIANASATSERESWLPSRATLRTGTAVLAVDGVATRRLDASTAVANVTVANYGTAAVRDVPVRLESGDTELATGRVEHVAPNRSATTTIRFDPADLDGPASDLVAVDPEGTLPDGAARTRSRTAWLLQPDLAVPGGVTYESRPEAGVVAHVPVANRGPGAANATVTVLDASTDQPRPLASANASLPAAVNGSAAFETVPIVLGDVDEGTAIEVRATTTVPDLDPLAAAHADEVTDVRDATGDLAVTVTNASSGAALSDATVDVDGRLLTTGDAGVVETVVPAGDREVTVRAPGHEPRTEAVTVGVDAEATLDVALDPTDDTDDGGDEDGSDDGSDEDDGSGDDDSGDDGSDEDGSGDDDSGGTGGGIGPPPTGPPSGGAEPSASATSLADGAVRIQVENARAGTPVSVDLEDASDGALAATSVELTPSSDVESATLRLEHADGWPADAAIADREALGGLQLSGDADAVEAATFEVAVDADALADRSVDPRDLALHASGSAGSAIDADDWEAADATVVDDGGERATLRVTTDRVGALAASVGAPSVEVADLAVDPATVESGETTTVGVDLRNDGDRAAEERVELALDGSVQRERTVTVEAGETRTLTFDVAVEAAGDHEIRVGDRTATVTATEPDDGGDDGSGDGGDGLPGFGPLVALAALAIVAGALLARRQRAP